MFLLVFFVLSLFSFLLLLQAAPLEALKMYVEHFHPRLVGLTGSVDQVNLAAKAYKVYFAKVMEGYEDGDYAMDHSSITYLMDPNGKFITHFSHGVEAQSMAEKISEILK